MTTGTLTRTFDCPWCGAISPVPADHLGEHFTCTECKKATKLTEKNTSSLPPTAPPPDAPHLTGDRTFDCPWCGAISSVPSSHLGERFHCPECQKETRLTPMNTRRAAVTAPPPEAPHVESASPLGLWIGVGVLVAIGVGWMILKGNGEPESVAPTDASRPVADAGAAVKPSVEPAAPSAQPSPQAPTPAGPETPPAQPTPPAEPATPPAPPAEDPVKVQALAALAAATDRFAKATADHEAATAAVAAWTKAHPGAAEALADLPGLEEVVVVAERMRADPKLFADPAKPTPAEVHAYDAALAAFVAGSAARTRAADKAFESLRHDLGGREVAGVASWQGMNFYGPGFRRASEALLGAAKALAAPVPEGLVRAEADARTAREAAKQALDAAAAAVPK